MKKLVLLMLAALLVATLAGCSKSNPDITSGNTSGTMSPSEPEKPTESNDPVSDPTSTPSVNPGIDPENYWISDSEFDMIGYCAAHGIDKFQVTEPDLGDPVIRLSCSGSAGGKTTWARSIMLGSGYRISANHNDYVALVATMFNATDTRINDSQAKRIYFTGVNVYMYDYLMDFVLYAIPRLADQSIEDPMRGFGRPHGVERAIIEVDAAGNYSIKYDGKNVEVVRD